MSSAIDEATRISGRSASALDRITGGILGPGDGRITAREVLNNWTGHTGEALEWIGVVRSSAGSGLQTEIAGFGDYWQRGDEGQWQAQEERRRLLSDLREKFTFPIVAGDGQRLNSAGEPTTSDLANARFSGTDEVASDAAESPWARLAEESADGSIDQLRESVASAASSEVETTNSSRTTAIVAAVIASIVGLAVFIGGYT